MALSDVTIRAAKPAERVVKLSDGGGLFLAVSPAGGKLWRLKYRFGGKEQLLSIGRYPDVGLKEARTRRDAARALIAAGKSPATEKRRAAAIAAVSAANTFAAVAEEFIAKAERETRAPATVAKARWFLSILKPLGARPIAEIEAFELLALLRPVERAGHHESARRTLAFASRVFRYAVATARASRDPAADLRGALTAPKVTHHAAIVEPAMLGGLLRAIEGFQGQPATRLALRLTPHVFVRPGELRQAEWAEIDFGAAVWRIPAARMKMRREHAVPLSRQSLAILQEAQALTGGGRLIFPAIGRRDRPISENTINAALRRMGYGADEMTAHGFRSTASTLLNESGKWSTDAIERALAHKDGDHVRAAYHRGTHWQERVTMAQWWSDHLDMLRNGAEVIPLRAAPGA